MTTPCSCAGTPPEKQVNWAVMQRWENRSAFNGYRPTPSAYSCVACYDCGAVWRTKAKYVSTLPDWKEEELIRRHPEQFPQKQGGK